MLPDKIKPYTSRGKRISMSTHHKDMWIVDLIGTIKFYTITSSKQLMLQNNPPDPSPKQIQKAKFEDLKKARLVIATNKLLPLIIIAVLLMSCGYRPISNVKQDVTTFQDGSHCLSTTVWKDGQLIRMLLVYDGSNKWQGSSKSWYVPKINDSIKCAQYKYGMTILSEEIEILSTTKCN